ncbi:hypothetical protein B0H11DRAFT_1978313 [Mycena galericulata]|nr:hypothetical protein B0H11DRAFT_1978313 [Mycena galericulata]
MAEGFVLAPPEQGSRKLNFGPEPILFDVWLEDRKNPALWADITPISAQPMLDGDHFSTLASSVSSKEAPPETLQVSVIVAMPQAPTASTEDLPNIAFGLAHPHYPSS